MPYTGVMAWDTDKTKQLLLDAAVQEFADHGFQGARVDRIAKTACVNKERIYQYFGNKQQLFTTVLNTELGKLAAAVPLTPEVAADLPEHVGRVYDYHQAHPHFVRLLHWEALECGDETVPAESERTEHYIQKIASIAEAQRRGAVGEDVRPEVLMSAVIALAGFWTALPQIVRMLMTGVADDTPESRREALVGLVRKIVA
jgi:AcrR family transcriptional regulator